MVFNYGPQQAPYHLLLQKPYKNKAHTCHQRKLSPTHMTHINFLLLHTPFTFPNCLHFMYFGNPIWVITRMLNNIKISHGIAKMT
jgi:hypothetical protein